jgi:hypothetical protein
MRRLTIILALAIVVFAVMLGGQVVVAEWTNLEFQDDLHDISTDLASRIGLTAPPSDQEIRALVLRKADRRGISLRPGQIKVTRSSPPENPNISLAADYEESINVPGYSLVLHFTPSSSKKSF